MISLQIAIKSVKAPHFPIAVSTHTSARLLSADCLLFSAVAVFFYFHLISFLLTVSVCLISYNRSICLRNLYDFVCLAGIIHSATRILIAFGNVLYIFFCVFFFFQIVAVDALVHNISHDSTACNSAKKLNRCQ